MLHDLSGILPSAPPCLCKRGTTNFERPLETRDLKLWYEGRWGSLGVVLWRDAVTPCRRDAQLGERTLTAYCEAAKRTPNHELMGRWRLGRLRLLS